jgi:hypothetical protein
MIGSFIGRISEMTVKQADYRKSEARLKVELLRAQVFWTYFRALGALFLALLALAALLQALR